MAEAIYEVADDSGVLALIDPDAYESFVASGRTLEQLLVHFKAQMGAKRLLIWGTGMENIWRVRVGRDSGEAAGFREVSGPIVTTRGRLLLTSYDCLTMAAQFKDATLPQAHERDLVLDVPPCEYRCRIVQEIDPDDYELQPHPMADFVLELLDCDEPLAPWSDLPWADL